MWSFRKCLAFTAVVVLFTCILSSLPVSATPIPSYFSVQVSTFINLDFALEELRTLEKKGYKPYVLFVPGKRRLSTYTVNIGRFSDKIRAERFRAVLMERDPEKTGNARIRETEAPLFRPIHDHGTLVSTMGETMEKVPGLPPAATTHEKTDMGPLQLDYTLTEPVEKSGSSPTEPTPSETIYSVQVFSSPNIENARNALLSTANKGHPAYLLLIPGKRHAAMYTVNVGNFADRQSAEQLQATIMQQDGPNARNTQIRQTEVTLFQPIETQSPHFFAEKPAQDNETPLETANPPPEEGPVKNAGTTDQPVSDGPTTPDNPRLSPNPESPVSFFSVQVLSFRAIENTHNALTELESKGYKPYLLLVPGKLHSAMYTVNIGKFTDRQQAEQLRTAYMERDPQNGIHTLIRETEFPLYQPLGADATRLPEEKTIQEQTPPSLAIGDASHSQPPSPPEEKSSVLTDSPISENKAEKIIDKPSEIKDISAPRSSGTSDSSTGGTNPLESSGVRLTLNTEMGYNDNYFNTENDAQSKETLRLKPGISWSTEWGSSNLETSYNGDFGYYPGSSADNFSDGSLKTSLKMALNERLGMDIKASYQTGHDDRGSDDQLPGTQTPNLWQKPKTEGSFTLGNPESIISSRITSRWENTIYTNNHDITGNLEKTEVGNQLELTYNYSEMTHWLSGLEYTNFDYAIRTAQNSFNLFYYIGAQWDPGDVFSTKVKVGTREKRFDNTDSNSDFSSLGWDGELTWRPLEYSKLTLSTGLDTAESSGGTADLNVERKLSLTWKHDWTESVSSDLGTHWTFTRYVGENESRRDQLWKPSIGVSYKIRDNISLSSKYEMTQKNSNQAGTSYRKNQVLLTMETSFD